MLWININCIQFSTKCLTSHIMLMSHDECGYFIHDESNCTNGINALPSTTTEHTNANKPQTDCGTYNIHIKYKSSTWNHSKIILTNLTWGSLNSRTMESISTPRTEQHIVGKTYFKCLICNFKSSANSIKMFLFFKWITIQTEIRIWWIL